MIVHLIAGLIKKDLVWFYCTKMSKYCPKPYKPFGRGIKVKVDLSNYAAKADIKILHMLILQVLH